MQKMRFPLDINFREFEAIIQKRLYGIFRVLSGQVKILFVHVEGDDISFFVRFISYEKHGTSVYVHLYFDPTVCDYRYHSTDLSTIKRFSILKRTKSP